MRMDADSSPQVIIGPCQFNRPYTAFQVDSRDDYVLHTCSSCCVENLVEVIMKDWQLEMAVGINQGN